MHRLVRPLRDCAEAEVSPELVSQALEEGLDCERVCLVQRTLSPRSHLGILAGAALYGSSFLAPTAAGQAPRDPQPAGPAGTHVLSLSRISDTHGGFTGSLDFKDWFGYGVAELGDLDGDGTPDVAVGAPGDDVGALNGGAIWILFLNPDGTVRSHKRMGSTFAGSLELLGSNLARPGDLEAGTGTGAPTFRLPREIGKSAAARTWSSAGAPDRRVPGGPYTRPREPGTGNS